MAFSRIAADDEMAVTRTERHWDEGRLRGHGPHRPSSTRSGYRPAIVAAVWLDYAASADSGVM